MMRGAGLYQAVGHQFGTRIASEQVQELLGGQPSLAEDRCQRAAGQLTVKRHDHGSIGIVAQLDVTSLLAYPNKPSPIQSADRFPARDDRQRRSHAGMLTGAMIGGSMPSGKG